MYYGQLHLFSNLELGELSITRITLYRQRLPCHSQQPSASSIHPCKTQGHPQAWPYDERPSIHIVRPVRLVRKASDEPPRRPRVVD